MGKPMNRQWAYLRRWFHGVGRTLRGDFKHRGETWQVNGRVVGIGCECGRYFYGASLVPFILANRDCCKIISVEYEGGSDG